ncbi:hypothetical protein DSECCO2_643940 [anaerobic digester metagenome]
MFAVFCVDGILYGVAAGDTDIKISKGRFIICAALHGDGINGDAGGFGAFAMGLIGILIAENGFGFFFGRGPVNIFPFQGDLALVFQIVGEGPIVNQGGGRGKAVVDGIQR